MKKEELRAEIKAVIAKVEQMKGDDGCPLLVASALFLAYGKLHEALYRLSTGKPSDAD